MSNKFSNKITVLFLSLAMLLSAAFVVSAQTGSPARTVESGQRLKLKGVVVSKQGDVVLVREPNGTETNVQLTGSTSVKSKGGFLRSGKQYANVDVVRGLSIEVEGRGDSTGQLVAEKIRFSNDDLKVAQAIESRVSPAEERISQGEQNAQRLSGQIDELMAISNATRGGAKAAQETADVAITGVNATNQRISSLDDYEVQSTISVNFKVGSAVLTPEGTQLLDTLAQSALATRGYVLEVTGYADASGDPKKNRTLSQKRADSVIQYLVETHSIPLRRILPTYGYGEAQAVADNTSREGRAQNRRVEVKVLVNRGLNQTIDVKNPNNQPPTDNKDNQ